MSTKTATTKKPAGKKTSAPGSSVRKKASEPPQISEDLRQQMIAEAAYYRAEQRGFHPDDHLRDWLEAEEEVEKMLKQF